MFINYLNISKKTVKNRKIIVFYWISWWWKSTYLNFLKNKFSDHLFLFHKEKKIEYIKTDKKNIFIDEIVYFHQMIIIFRYILDWKRIFIATHINLFFYKIIFYFIKSKFYTTEKSEVKIKEYLKYRWIEFNDSSIKFYLKKYKWSFNEIDFMIEHYYNIANFEELIYLFEKECKITYKINK